MYVENLEPVGPNKEENIRRVENGEEVKFPADYREFLLTVGGGMFPNVRELPKENRPKILGISALSDGVEFFDRIRALFGCICEQNLKYDIENTLWQWDWDEEAIENPYKIIPIGISECGNLFVMELSKEYYGNISYVDRQELFDITKEEEAYFFPIADSFTELLEMINK